MRPIGALSRVLTTCVLLFSIAFALMESKSSEGQPDMLANFARAVALGSLIVIGAVALFGGDKSEGAFGVSFGLAFDRGR